MRTTSFDNHYNTIFQKNNIFYSYASFEELESFAGIKLSDLNEKSDNGDSFKVLTLEQYLAVYTASLKDGYRINIRQKKDQDKITLISKYL